MQFFLIMQQNSKILKPEFLASLNQNILTIFIATLRLQQKVNQQ